MRRHPRIYFIAMRWLSVPAYTHLTHTSYNTHTHALSPTHIHMKETTPACVCAVLQGAELFLVRVEYSQRLLLSPSGEDGPGPFCLPGVRQSRKGIKTLDYPCFSFQLWRRGEWSHHSNLFSSCHVCLSWNGSIVLCVCGAETGSVDLSVVLKHSVVLSLVSKNSL